MKHIFSIIGLVLIMFSCKDDLTEVPKTADISMWDYLQEDETHSYYVALMQEYLVDTLLINQNTYTLFIPDDESLKALNRDSIDFSQLLAYWVVPTYVNVHSFSKAVKIKTQSNKFALLENNPSAGGYTFDGVEILFGSPVFSNGRYYTLSNIVKPANNLYEYISIASTAFKDFIDLQDSVYFDVAASTPVDFSLEGTIYDSVFTTVNLFDYYYFPVKEEFRTKAATFIVFTQEQLEEALDEVKLDLNIDEIPEEWINEILMPNLVSNLIFNNNLQYNELESRMVNIKGDSVDVAIENVMEDSRTICSNGVVFSLNDFSISDSLYKSQNVFNGKDAALVEVIDKQWTWSKDVIIKGLEGTNIRPILEVLEKAGERISKNNKVLSLDLSNYTGKPGDFSMTYNQKGVFGASNYRLVWYGSGSKCGLWKIKVNGEYIQMRNERGIASEYFDSYLFYKDVIRSVTGVPGNFTGGDGYNAVDFEIKNITEYGDVEITFEYHGPTILGAAFNRTPGFVIDYVVLEIY